VSVINKMLRDLDNRREPGTQTDPSHALARDFVRGTATVNPLGITVETTVRRGEGLKMVTAAVLLGLGVLVAGYVWWQGDRANPVPASSGPALPVVAALPAKAEPAALAAAPASAPMPVAMPPLVAVPVATAQKQPASAFSLKMDTQARLAPNLYSANPATPAVPVARTVASSVALITPPASQVGTAAAPTLPKASSPAALPALPQVSQPSSSSPPSSVPATPVPNPATQRQSAATEALAQAQSLWSTGSREAAMELLREAVAVAERSAGAASGNFPALIPLVRELSRMELAEGQASRALELLTRLEPLLFNQADLWAVRGNAAQRMGQHQESANAYLRALKIRPDEPRWMLGAAVSLAAQGQTAAAADLAEKARMGGVLSREVATYLRQLGVPIRDQ
jgi:MSHA biogenesis protein MshN